LNQAVNGGKPFGFHLQSHAARGSHLAAVLAVAGDPRDLAASEDFGARGSFAVRRPSIHTEAVASVVGRAELLAAGFLLAAWILHLRDRRSPR